MAPDKQEKQAPARDEREVLREALRDLLSTMVLREGDMGITGPAILRARAALRAAPTPTPAEWRSTKCGYSISELLAQAAARMPPSLHALHDDLLEAAVQPPAPTAEQGKALGKDEGAPCPECAFRGGRHSEVCPLRGGRDEDESAFDDDWDAQSEQAKR